MRQSAAIAMLAIAGVACSADITGSVTIGKTTKSDLSVGYIGVDQNRNKLTNSCGMSVGAGSAATGVWCTTYKPRNSELQFKNGRYTFKHVVLPPGKYYVYAKLGETLMLGKVVTVVKANETKSLNIDLSKVKTGNLAFTAKAKGEWSIRIAPANPQGKALIGGLDLNQELRIECKVVKGNAGFRFLPAGKYLVQLLKITQSGGSGGSHWEAYEIAGSFSVDVVSGKTLQYQLN